MSGDEVPIDREELDRDRVLGRPYELLVKLVPDGTCGMAVDGEPIGRSRVASAAPSAPHRVVSYGKSLDTRFRVGDCEVWTGVDRNVDGRDDVTSPGSLDDGGNLEAALLDVARNGLVTSRMRTEHGMKYIVGGELSTPAGTPVTLRTVWLRERRAPAPRLMTAYPL